MRIRPCQETDLDALEWEGEFAHDRPLIDRSFARCAEGAMVMLVAEDAGTHLGQVWINFGCAREPALIWALRVKPAWRCRGIGTQLVRAAERVIAGRGIPTAELEVEPANRGAWRLYERLGYVHVRSVLARDGAGRVTGPSLVVLRRSLAPRPGEDRRARAFEHAG